jgi:hypothetical protein
MLPNHVRITGVEFQRYKNGAAPGPQLWQANEVPTVHSDSRRVPPIKFEARVQRGGALASPSNSVTGAACSRLTRPVVIAARA